MDANRCRNVSCCQAAVSVRDGCWASSGSCSLVAVVLASLAFIRVYSRFFVSPEPSPELLHCLDIIRSYCEFMKQVRKLLHTRYRVDDLERTVSFYRDVLGLEEVRRHKSPRGSELVFMKAPESDEEIELCSFPASGPVRVQPDLTHLAFQVNSLEEFGKHLASMGLAYSDGPHQSKSGAIAFIDAPEGYEVELIERSAKPNSPSGSQY